MAEEATKETRRLKIRQLEASLFGSEPGPDTTALPELQRVNEYASQFGQAERKKSAKAMRAVREARTFLFPKYGNDKLSRLGDGGLGLGSEGDQLIASADTSPQASLEPSPTITPTSRAGRAPLRAFIFGRTDSTRRLIRSESQELDQSIQTLMVDPQRNVLDNLRRRHGVVGRSPSYDLLREPDGPVTGVLGHEDKLGRATVLQSPGVTIERVGSGRTRSSSLGPVVSTASKLLAEEQADLEQGMKRSPADVDAVHLSVRWPQMPQIKATLPVAGAKRESLQPLPQTSRKNSSASNDDSVFSSTKLPAISRQASSLSADGRDLDDEAERRRRKSSARSNRSSPESPQSGRNSSMISFDNLEYPQATAPSSTFKDVPRVVEGVPSVLADMESGKTFDLLPTNIFDFIPTVMTEREERRLQRRHKKDRRSSDGGVASDAQHAEEAAEGDNEGAEHPSPSMGAAGLIASLFPNATVIRRRQDHMDSDFMFALFVQNKENSALTQAGSHTAPVTPTRDPDVGHFCAPFVPGFCEANHCIFHSSSAKMANGTALN